jgi:hypothetical protein
LDQLEQLTTAHHAFETVVGHDRQLIDVEPWHRLQRIGLGLTSDAHVAAIQVRI